MSEFEHEMLPSICFRRLIDGCHRIVGALDRRHAAGLNKHDAIDDTQSREMAMAYLEMAHLAAMDKAGVLGPLYDVLAVADACAERGRQVRYEPKLPRES